MMTRFFKNTAMAGAWLAATVLALMFLLGISEIVARSAFGTSLSFSVEIISYMILLVLFWGSGWAMVGDHHISMSLLTNMLPKRWQTALTALNLVVASFLALLILAALLMWTWETYQRGDVSFYPLATPLWIPQLLLSFGPFFLFCGAMARLLERKGVE